MELYLCSLVHHQLVKYKFVRKEVFEWITNTDPGISEDDEDAPIWEDQTCPGNLKKEIYENNGLAQLTTPYERYMVQIRQGCYRSDRANMAPRLEQHGEKVPEFESVKEVTNWLKNLNVEVDETSDGELHTYFTNEHYIAQEFVGQLTD